MFVELGGKEKNIEVWSLNSNCDEDERIRMRLAPLAAACCTHREDDRNVPALYQFDLNGFRRTD